FNLGRPPLLRFHVHKRGEDRFQLTITENHAIQDGWSLHSNLEEIFSNYLGLMKHGKMPERPPLQVKYSDFVYLEKQAIADPECREYWKNKLSDYNALKVVEALRETQSIAQEKSHWVEVPRHISDGLKDVAAKAAVPLKSVLLATHLKVLSFLS